MSNKYITGLDIGTSSIKAVIAEVKNNNQLVLIKAIKTPSGGLRRGIVDDLSETTRALNQLAFSEIKKVSKEALKNLYLNIGGADVRIQSSKGIVAVSRADNEIYQDDVDRAIKASQAINLPPNRMVIHSIIKEFLVDGMGDIRDPLGMVGNRLEVNSFLIDVFSPRVKNLTRCVEMAGANIGGLILNSLASARSVLSKNQKDLGVAVVDIGAGTTSLCVYGENKLLHTAVFPAGSANITNDLAIGLKTTIDAAETVKLSFGSVMSRAAGRETVDLKKIDPNSKVNPTKKFISEIIESRLSEIFEFVGNELKLIGEAGRLPAGVVLVGGGAKIPGVVDLAKQELKLPVQIGIPETSALEVLDGELNLQVEDPEFACAMGLVLSADDQLAKLETSGDIYGWFKKMFGHLLP